MIVFAFETGDQLPGDAAMTQYSMLERVDAIAADLSHSASIGLDTEFMREKTFFADLCLLQVATTDAIYCVDPLGSIDMREFWNVIMPLTWVAHSARQDIEVIYQTAGRMPSALLDTQIAAGLLGYAPQLGYAGLVSELFGIELPKSHTRANWSHRPLSDAELQYAAEDVAYLLPAWHKLAERLDKLGRLDWVREDSAALLDPALYDVDPAQAIQRLKGARNLRGRRRAAAARLAEWREAEALRANRPRQWIAKDAVLLEIANRLPRAMDELAAINDMPGGLARRSGRHILELINVSGAEDNAVPTPQLRPDETQKAQLADMQRMIAECAADLGLAAETVASKKELSALVMDKPSYSRVLSGWRLGIVGESLRKLI